MREKSRLIVLASAIVCGLLLLHEPYDAEASAGSRNEASFERVVPDLAHARDYGIDYYMVQAHSHRTTITPIGLDGGALGKIVVTDGPEEFGLRIEDASRAARDWSFRKLSEDRFLVRLQSHSATGEIENSVFHYDVAAAEVLAVDPDGRIITVPQPMACSDPDPSSAGVSKPDEALTAVGAALTDPNLREYLPTQLRGFTAGLDGGVVTPQSSCATCIASCGACLACAVAGCGGAVACAGCAGVCLTCCCTDNCKDCYRDFQEER